MKIPISYHIGTRRITVEDRLTIPGGYRGRAFADYGVVQIAVKVKRVVCTPEERADTFWHETVHMILHDMGHPQWRDEAFVDAFARRIHQVARTAKFKD